MARPPRHLIAGNWKMNLVRNDAIALVCDMVTRLETAGESCCDVAVCPPALLLPTVAEALGKSAIALGAQDCHAEPSGAHTGDIAAAMLADAGCACVIVGHSERRADHGEDDALVRAKAKAVQDCAMTAIICVGETLAERDGGKTLRVVSDQLNASLPMGAGAANTVIAYEPVWAIGTGRTPTPDQVAEVHASIRGDLEQRFAGADQVRILYGGSVKPDNATELMALANVNGALVGGASLNAGDFWAICESCPSDSV